jgi:hypothetical protein
MLLNAGKSLPFRLGALGVPTDRRAMVSSETTYLGTRLDEHHLPETNGRMSVCRRCGSQTDGPEGNHHAPHQQQLTRANGWLISQSRISSIDRARQLRAH